MLRHSKPRTVHRFPVHLIAAFDQSCDKIAKDAFRGETRDILHREQLWLQTHRKPGELIQKPPFFIAGIVGAPAKWGEWPAWCTPGKQPNTSLRIQSCEFGDTEQSHVGANKFGVVVRCEREFEFWVEV